MGLPHTSIPCFFTVLDDCSNLASWTAAIGTDCALVENSDANYIINGTKSFKFSLEIDAGASHRIDLTKNFSYQFIPDDRLGVLMYVPNKPTNSTSGLFIFGSDQINLGSGGVGRWNRNFGASSGIGIETQGWQIVPIQFGDTAITSGAPTRNLQYLSFRLQATASATLRREFYIDSIVKWNSKPTIMFQFDDGHASGYIEGHDYLASKGFPCTLFLIDSLIESANGGNPNYMTSAQCLTAMASGSTLGGHGVTTNGWELDPSSIHDDVDALRQRFGLPFYHCAYPNGGYGETAGNYEAVQDALYDDGILSCRTVDKALLCPGAYSPYTLPASINLQTGVSLAQAKAEIDRCVKLQLSCVVIAHKLEAVAAASTWDITSWRALVDYVYSLYKLGIVDVMNMEEWWYGSKIPR